MATRKATSLDADLIARKGEAAPAQVPTPPTLTSSVLHGTKDTVALTLRLDQERYRRLYLCGRVCAAQDPPGDPGRGPGCLSRPGGGMTY
jgi:hypothetical protein